ncbi:hypothetical protein BN1013_00270 [Candidatus Rubidus massiliensis]|nr:hypothetical protein BN1013_00270 [Candidatus Rubidus massiliensis]
MTTLLTSVPFSKNFCPVFEQPLRLTSPLLSEILLPDGKPVNVTFDHPILLNQKNVVDLIDSIFTKPSVDVFFKAFTKSLSDKIKQCAKFYMTGGFVRYLNEVCAKEIVQDVWARAFPNVSTELPSVREDPYPYHDLDFSFTLSNWDGDLQDLKMEMDLLREKLMNEGVVKKCHVKDFYGQAIYCSMNVVLHDDTSIEFSFYIRKKETALFSLTNSLINVEALILENERVFFVEREHAFFFYETALLGLYRICYIYNPDEINEQGLWRYLHGLSKGFVTWQQKALDTIAETFFNQCQDLMPTPPSYIDKTRTFSAFCKKTYLRHAPNNLIYRFTLLFNLYQLLGATIKDNSWKLLFEQLKKDFAELKITSLDHLKEAEAVLCQLCSLEGVFAKGLTKVTFRQVKLGAQEFYALDDQFVLFVPCKPRLPLNSWTLNHWEFFSLFFFRFSPLWKETLSQEGYAFLLEAFALTPDIKVKQAIIVCIWKSKYEDIRQKLLDLFVKIADVSYEPLFSLLLEHNYPLFEELTIQLAFEEKLFWLAHLLDKPVTHPQATLFFQKVSFKLKRLHLPLYFQLAYRLELLIDSIKDCSLEELEVATRNPLIRSFLKEQINDNKIPYPLLLSKLFYLIPNPLKFLASLRNKLLEPKLPIVFSLYLSQAEEAFLENGDMEVYLQEIETIFGLESHFTTFVAFFYKHAEVIYYKKRDLNPAFILWCEKILNCKTSIEETHCLSPFFRFLKEKNGKNSLPNLLTLYKNNSPNPFLQILLEKALFKLASFEKTFTHIHQGLHLVKYFYSPFLLPLATELIKNSRVKQETITLLTPIIKKYIKRIPAIELIPFWNNIYPHIKTISFEELFFCLANQILTANQTLPLTNVLEIKTKLLPNYPTLFQDLTLSYLQTELKNSSSTLLEQLLSVMPYVEKKALEPLAEQAIALETNPIKILDFLKQEVVLSLQKKIDILRKLVSFVETIDAEYQLKSVEKLQFFVKIFLQRHLVDLTNNQKEIVFNILNDFYQILLLAKQWDLACKLLSKLCYFLDLHLENLLIQIENFLEIITEKNTSNNTLYLPILEQLVTIQLSTNEESHSALFIKFYGYYDYVSLVKLEPQIINYYKKIKTIDWQNINVDEYTLKGWHNLCLLFMNAKIKYFPLFFKDFFYEIITNYKELIFTNSLLIEPYLSHLSTCKITQEEKNILNDFLLKHPCSIKDELLHTLEKNCLSQNSLQEIRQKAIVFYCRKINLSKAYDLLKKYYRTFSESFFRKYSELLKDLIATKLESTPLESLRMIYYILKTKEIFLLKDLKILTIIAEKKISITKLEDEEAISNLFTVYLQLCELNPTTLSTLINSFNKMMFIINDIKIIFCLIKQLSVILLKKKEVINDQIIKQLLNTIFDANQRKKFILDYIFLENIFNDYLCYIKDSNSKCNLAIKAISLSIQDLLLCHSVENDENLTIYSRVKTFINIFHLYFNNCLSLGNTHAISHYELVSCTVKFIKQLNVAPISLQNEALPTLKILLSFSSLVSAFPILQLYSETKQFKNPVILEILLSFIAHSIDQSSNSIDLNCDIVRKFFCNFFIREQFNEIFEEIYIKNKKYLNLPEIEENYQYWKFKHSITLDEDFFTYPCKIKIEKTKLKLYERYLIQFIDQLIPEDFTNLSKFFLDLYFFLLPFDFPIDKSSLIYDISGFEDNLQATHVNLFTCRNNLLNCYTFDSNNKLFFDNYDEIVNSYNISITILEKAFNYFSSLTIYKIILKKIKSIIYSQEEITFENFVKIDIFINYLIKNEQTRKLISGKLLYRLLFKKIKDTRYFYEVYKFVTIKTMYTLHCKNQKSSKEEDKKLCFLLYEEDYLFLNNQANVVTNNILIELISDLKNITSYNSFLIIYILQTKLTIFKTHIKHLITLFTNTIFQNPFAKVLIIDTHLQQEFIQNKEIKLEQYLFELPMLLFQSLFSVKKVTNSKLKQGPRKIISKKIEERFEDSNNVASSFIYYLNQISNSIFELKRQKNKEFNALQLVALNKILYNHPFSKIVFLEYTSLLIDHFTRMCQENLYTKNELESEYFSIKKFIQHKFKCSEENLKSLTLVYENQKKFF